jgi:hypothetical protein
MLLLLVSTMQTSSVLNVKVKIIKYFSTCIFLTFGYLVLLLLLIK